MEGAQQEEDKILHQDAVEEVIGDWVEKHLEDRIAFLTDRRADLLPQPVPRRQKVVNSFPNPVGANNTTGVALSGAGIGTVALSRLTGLTDGPFEEVTTAFRLLGTPTGDVTIGWGDATYPVAADSSEASQRLALVHVAAMVRTPAVKADTNLLLGIISLNASNQFQGFVYVNGQKVTVGNEWTLIEGFAILGSTTRRVTGSLTVNGAGGAPLDLQATILTTVVNPVGSVPVLPCGSRTGHAWAGTAHASASVAYAHADTPQPHGFNDTSPVSFDEDTLDISVRESVGLLTEIGATHVRSGVLTFGDVPPWPSANAKINWTPTYLGQYLEALREAGLKMVVEVGNAPDWFTNPWRADMTDEEYGQLGELYAKLAEQYSDVIEAMELSNEPNASNYWGNPVSPERYVAFAEAMYTAIKAAAPEMTVLSGGMTPWTGAKTDSAHPYDSWLSDCYAAGLSDFCDAVSVHPYPVATHPYRDVTNTSFADGFTEVIRKTLAVMDSHGDTDKLLWLTEFGVPTDGAGSPLNLSVNEAQQAAMLSLLVGMASRHPRVGGIFVHDLFNTGTTGRFGVVDWPKLRRRQSFFALQQAFGRNPDARVWGPWRNVGSSGEVAFSANWGNVAATNEPLRYRENGQTVQVRGRVKRTGVAVAGEAIAGLPIGTNGDADLRPRQDANVGYGSVYALSVNSASGLIQWWAGDPATVFTIEFEYPLT